MDLGLIWGYWGRGMPDDFVELTVAAEKAGYDTVWTAESWGSDAFSYAVSSARWASSTSESSISWLMSFRYSPTGLSVVPKNSYLSNSMR